MRRNLLLALLVLLIGIACSDDLGQMLGGEGPSIEIDPIDARYLGTGPTSPPPVELAGQPAGAPFAGHEGRVTALAFTPDGTSLVSGSFDDRTIALWRADGAAVDRARLPDRINDLAIDPDGTVVTADAYDHLRFATIGDDGLSTGRTIDGEAIDHLAISPNGRLVATSAWEKVLEIRDAATGAVLVRHASDVGLRDLAFGPGGRHLVVGHATGASFTLWDVGKGAGWNCRVAKAAADADVMAVAFDPTGRRVAVSLNETTLSVWEVDGRREVANWYVRDQPARAVAFGPDGTLLATGHQDGRIRLWNPATGDAVGVLEGHATAVHALAFSPDGSRLASGAEDGSIAIWR